jgi:hypothetical protein
MKPATLFLLLSSGLTLTLGQSIDCIYTDNYQCLIILNNPQGFDNFTSIGGAHLQNRTNADVTVVSSYTGTSLNVPSIICEQFPNLIEITLTGRGITTLTERSFAECKVIKRIHLWNNKINTPPVNLLVSRL